MAQGQLVPDELVVGLLHNVIKSAKVQKFLIDGFPRNISQAKLLESKIKEIDLILDIHVGEQILVERLLERAKTSGRVDDNPESIKKRIHTFHEATEPVLEYYKKFGKIKHIDGTKSVDEVFK
jgi:adenylate kinase family enzyme